MTYNYLKVSNSIVKITRFSPVFCIVGLAVLVGCSADYRVRNDFRNVYDGLTDSYLVTLDYNLSSGQDYYADHIAVPMGGVFSFPTVITDPTLRRKENGITMVLESWNETPTGTGVGYDLGVSSDPVTESRTYYAQWTPIGGIGPAGGIVVYDKGTVSEGWRYLEMAVGAASDINVPWHTAIYLDIDTDTGIGTGKWNTYKIVGNFNFAYGVASEIFAAYSLNTFTDWFLPSLLELQCAAEYLPEYNTYWSSSSLGTMAYAVTGPSPEQRVQTNGDAFGRPFRVFKDEHPTASIFYATNGLDVEGDPPYDDVVHQSGDSVTVQYPMDLTRDGYVFSGWKTTPSGSGDTYQEDDEITLDRDMILYAQWTSNP